MTSYSPQSSAHSQQPSSQPSSHRRLISKQRFATDLSQCLFDFVIQLLPSADEMAIKEDVRKLLERLIRTIEPESRLLSFGSTGNGFALRNSDMDLCCLIDSEERLAASDLVTMVGDLLERETKFHVKPLPHARIPIVKLSLDPSPGLPLGIACDIGFENRLALENTRLLMCYAMIDPTRVRTLVLFLKVWSKRRKINAPYKGTLSSYGYVLLVIYFFVHVKNPPVLPNLQQMPPLRPITKEDTHLNGYNIWFFDDIELLRQRWQSSNSESVAELLIEFFRYFSRDFPYNTGVVSIRAGLLKKNSKGWQNDVSAGRINDARERNRFCIEDPFEIDFNVARCVTKDGLYTIRGEFMRASRILAARPDRAITAISELCEERKDEELISPPPYIPPRLSLPPQTPYTVGSHPIRPKVPIPEHLSPPTKFFDPALRLPSIPQVPHPPPPAHMAAKRSKWTSPPPPEAPSADHTLFENQLGIGLELATASTEAREREASYTGSSSNSEVFSDEEHPSDPGESDDVLSVRSFTEGSTSDPAVPPRRTLWSHSPESSIPMKPVSSSSLSELSPRIGYRGRLLSRLPERPSENPNPSPKITTFIPSHSKSEAARRSVSGPPRTLNGLGRSPNAPAVISAHLPHPPLDIPVSETITVLYETTAIGSPSPTRLHPLSGPNSPLLPQFDRYQTHLTSIGSTSQLPQLPDHPIENPRTVELAEAAADWAGGPSTPTPSTYARSTHSHSQSASTITAPTPPPCPLEPIQASDSSSATPRPQSNSPPLPLEQPILDQKNGLASPHTNGSNSPTNSSTGYATSLSGSPSPPPQVIQSGLKAISDDSQTTSHSDVVVLQPPS